MSQGNAKISLTFAIYRGEEMVGRETITQEIIKVGNDPKSHLCLDDEAASRMHAVVEVASDDDITLIDLGNEPGTFVNGERVNKRRLQLEDEIQIGGTRIVLEKTEPVGAAPESNPEPIAPAPSATNPFAAAAVASNPFAHAAPATNPFATAPNPFGAKPNETLKVAPTEPEVEGTYTYKMVPAGPEINPSEYEDSGVASVEVMIMWGTTVLHVQHLTPPRSYYVGEEQGKNYSCDYFLPAEKLGSTRAPIVVADRGAAHLVILPRATGTIELPGQPKMTLEEAVAGGKAQNCAELSGAHQIALPAGAKAKMEVGDLVFQVNMVAAGKRAIIGPMVSRDWTLAYSIAGSFAAVVGLLMSMAFFPVPDGLIDEDGMSRDQLRLIRQYLQASAEKEQEQVETEQVSETNADNKEGGTGTRAKGEEGSMGNPNTRDTGKRYGVQGPADNPDPHIARQAALREAAEFGMIGLLNTGAGGDPDAPTAPWGRDTSLGNDPLSARGNMWGDSIGDAFGAGGLGLSGIGEGGGGRGEGIGLGSIGTIGHGAGTGSGQGFGSGHGRLGGTHKTRAPQVRMGATQVNGRLPPEVIQRIVRQNYGRFRLCYENGLRSNPNLQGRVAVRFVIGRDGAVSNVSNGGSDLPDASVIQCVIRAYYGLSFPQPEGGIVTVVYPIMFSPGD